MIVGLFEATHIVGVAMTTQVVKEPFNNNLIKPSSKFYQMGVKK
jgi:hypothetical protein